MSLRSVQAQLANNLSKYTGNRLRAPQPDSERLKHLHFADVTTDTRNPSAAPRNIDPAALQGMPEQIYTEHLFSCSENPTQLTPISL